MTAISTRSVRKFINRSLPFSILLGCSPFSLGLTASCGDSGNDVPEVTVDEIAAYEQKVAEAEARANAEGAESGNR